MKPGKWVYLLTSLFRVRKAGEVGIEEIDLQGIGIRLKGVFLTRKQRIGKVHPPDTDDYRFVFYVNDGTRDDNLAQGFADAVIQ